MKSTNHYTRWLRHRVLANIDDFLLLACCQKYGNTDVVLRLACPRRHPCATSEGLSRCAPTGHIDMENTCPETQSSTATCLH
jgi:hypothetical protein